MSLGRCLVLCSALGWADPIVFNDDGAWNWFQDERAVIHGKFLYVGSVAAGVRDPARVGAVEVVTYNLETGQRSRAALHEPQTPWSTGRFPTLRRLPNPS